MTTQPESPDADRRIDEFRAGARQWLADNAPAFGWRPGSRGRRADRDADRAVERAKQTQGALADAGYAGIAWPKEFGGGGLGLREQILFNLEAQDYDLPIGPFSIGIGMCGPTLMELGTPEQKDRYLRPLLRGEEIWCQLFSEPAAGSDVAALRTRATRDGDSWVLNGQKVWTSGAQHCDFGLVLARTDPDLPKHKGITMFVVDMLALGVTVRPIKQMSGEAHFNEVFFDDVVIPVNSLVGQINEGWTAGITTLMNERVCLGAVRQLDDAHEATWLYELARERGRGDGLALRQRLADVWIRERVTVLLGERVVASVLMGSMPGPEGSVVKLVRTEFTRRSAHLGAELAGPAAMAWPPGPLPGTRFTGPLLLMPALSIAGGTDEVLKNIIGERVLGLPREPQVDRDQPFRELVTAEGTSR